MNAIVEGAAGARAMRGLAAGTGGAEGLIYHEEVMPFTVKIVRTETELSKAVQIRHAAYARHVPELAKLLREAEPYDHDEGAVVLLAESKLDGAPLGTMRVQTNLCRPLALEGSVELPDWLQGCVLAEATRLGVTLGRVGHLVKTMLFKAYFHYCLEMEVDWMVVAGRSPLDRQYDALLFSDVFPGRGYIPMQHAGNIPHRVLAMEPKSLEPIWREARHPLYDSCFRTHHPDVDLGALDRREPILSAARRTVEGLLNMGRAFSAEPDAAVLAA
ncbi:MAG: hypothetical protein OEW21_17730 [Betaproteobacteria bacterium]|nr:hypothetical protein [Betaproteobacteria bacterium]